MDITQKISRDINQFKSVPISQSSTSPNLSYSATNLWHFPSLITPYTIGLVVFIIFIFGAWIAWDWYNTKYKNSKKDESTSNKVSDDSVEKERMLYPNVILENAQKAMENALGLSHTKWFGDPKPEDLAESGNRLGWCYIGEDQGLSVCVGVTQKDKCMSGKVYPTEGECRKKRRQ